jgi:uncharacterized protein with FMN-binding domain
LRRVILAICATAVGLVLLLSFKSHTQSAAAGAPAAALGTPSPGPGSAGAGSSGSGSSSSGSSSSGSSGSGSSGSGAARPAPGGSPGSGTGASSTRASGAATTVTGAAWPTVYGPVQVRITVSGGKLTAVTAVEYPTGTPRDVQINAFAIPELNSEALAAGNAHIDAVSGATYTTQGYLGSLQNALDRAGLS